MSIGTATPGALDHANGIPNRADVLVADGIRVPGWVVDLETYRKWARSEDYPHSAWVSFLDGAIFVDPNIEELFTHNQVKGAYAFVIMSALGPTPSGMYVHDRMLLTNQAANLSTEPDGLFFFWTTIQAGRLRMIEGADGYTELAGSPDMVLEIVSKHSVRKDTVLMRELYWKADIPEFWLVDARGAEPSFRYCAMPSTITSRPSRSVVGCRQRFSGGNFAS
jgi:Uma2 family endonuclease